MLKKIFALYKILFNTKNSNSSIVKNEWSCHFLAIKLPFFCSIYSLINLQEKIRIYI